MLLELSEIIIITNLLIFCSIISDYYQCWKRTVFIWNRNLCMIINHFTVTFDQFNSSLPNESISIKMQCLCCCCVSSSWFWITVLRSYKMKHTRPIHVISQQTSCARAQRKLYNVMQWMFMAWPCTSWFVWEIWFYSDAWFSAVGV